MANAEDLLERNQQWVTLALPLIGKGIGYVARIIALNTTKYCFDMRGIIINIGRPLTITSRGV